MQVTTSLGWRRACVLATLAMASPVAAQNPTSKSCDPGVVRGYKGADVAQGWARYLPDSLIAAHAGVIAVGDFPAVARALAGDARSMAALGGVAPTDAALMANRFVELADAFGALATAAETAQPSVLALTVKASDFQLNPVRANYPVFAGTPQQIVVTPAMNVSAQQALCWPVIAADIVLTEIGAPWRARTVEKLKALSKRWDSFIGDGYSQFPWELALNSALRSPMDYEPPAVQFILLHPSLSAEARGSSLTRLTSSSALAIEALGALFYNTDHTRYAGASLVTTAAAGLNASAGVYLHLWFPQMTAGYVWRKNAVGDITGAAVLSLDLYKFVSKSTTDAQTIRDEALSGKLTTLLKTP